MTASGDATLLDRYHADPGKTVAMLEPFRDALGRSSYQVLAQEVGDLPADASVLDIACGDGYLLALLAARGKNRLFGIDRSPEEVVAARARLGPGVPLYCQDATTLPFPARSMNAVVCHMALMLMPTLTQVLAEIARVLLPGHSLVAIINRPHPDPVFAVYSRELRRITAAAGLERLQLGPPDIFSPAGVRAHLSQPYFDESSLFIHDFVVQLKTSPQELWPLLESTYDVFRLPVDAKVALQQTLLTSWNALRDDSGQVTAAMGLRLIKCSSFARAGSM